MSYSLSIFKKEVVSESLYAKSLEKGAQSRKIFERNDSGVKFNSKFKSSETLVNSTVDSGSTLISYAKGLKVQQLKETYDILRGIFMFSPMQVKAIGPEFINFLLFRDGKVNSENQDKLSKLRNDLLDFSVLLLKSYDIPISDIEIKTKESGENYLIITPKTLNDNVLNLTFSEARDYYSEGTFNTILLVILISLMSNGKRILLLDEIDGSLHHRLSLELIKMMRNSHKDINTQFILSTHDIMLLDNEFRRDSIFITSKDDKLETIISRVSDFSLRKDAKISAKYLADEFGALPKILTDESEKILSEISEFSMESSEND
ncbi:AAA family ATPase [Vibrio parahaemolyticus]|uniref:AAA family ATPase n=1 Tax=Vibrio parahaemolyticus TaxID=670 RepID=UPI00226A0960|nr:AAA family ATPase [Vibrio parahaemolyticus]MCX8814380.1 ATP-binding protein [Vibrio parahaemolyticus]